MTNSARGFPIAVLVSGGGTNLQALIDASAGSDHAARVVVVISDRPGVRALERAAAAGIPTEVVSWKGASDREAFTGDLCDAAERHGAHAMVLAGFMRILAPNAMKRFPDAIINTHPALLPAFPGAHAVPQALAHGVKLSGVTIHFVDEEVDHGPIIYQEAVAVMPDDTEDQLQARIQAVEHRAYPMVIDAFCRNRLAIEGRTVDWKEAP